MTPGTTTRDTVIFNIAAERNAKVHPREMWPPNSADLNPMDYSVWGILQERSIVRGSMTVKELKEHLLREWRLLE